MKRIIKWALVIFISIFALGIGYIGVIFLILGPMMGPRGDIDYDDFTQAQKRSAEIQAMLTQIFGLIPIGIATLLFVTPIQKPF